MKKSPLPETSSFEMFCFLDGLGPFFPHTPVIFSASCVAYSSSPSVNMLSPQVKLDDSNPMPDMESHGSVTALILTLAHALKSLASSWTGEGDARKELESKKYWSCWRQRWPTLTVNKTTILMGVKVQGETVVWGIKKNHPTVPEKNLGCTKT